LNAIECINKCIFKVTILSKGRILLCADALDLVIILIAFFCSRVILFKADWEAQLVMIEQ
jgi:hypothetical protein